MDLAAAAWWGAKLELIANKVGKDMLPYFGLKRN